MAEPKNKKPASDGPATAEVPNEAEQLRAKLTEAEQARDQNLDLAQRTQAEFENYQKRAQRENAAALRYAQAPLAFDCSRVLDNLDRAVAAAEQAGETGPLVQGVAMVQSQMLDVLRRHGITRIEAQGKPFDPNLHQAVMQQPSKDQPPGTVLQVLEHGYESTTASCGRPASSFRRRRPSTKRGMKSHADLRISVRRLRPRFRGIPVDVGGAADEVSQVRQEEAAAAVRHGRRVMFKGSGFYETDYRSESYKKAAKADQEAGKPSDAATKPSDAAGKPSDTTGKNGASDAASSSSVEKGKKSGTKKSKSEGLSGR